MAIHDVDKSNNDRNAPLPNSHDVREGVRLAHGTTSFTPVTDASETVTSATGTGTLRVVWQYSTQVEVEAGSGFYTVRYRHDLGTTPMIFCNGEQIHGNVTNYIAAINNNLSGGFSLGIYNDSLNTFSVTYDDIDGHIGGDNTFYLVVFKACLFT